MILEPQSRRKLRLPVSFEVKAVLIYAKLANFIAGLYFLMRTQKPGTTKCYFENKASKSDTRNRHL